MQRINHSLETLRTSLVEAQDREVDLGHQRLHAELTRADGLDEEKFHGGPKPLPLHLRAGEAISAARAALPTLPQVVEGGALAAKFALYAPPGALAGGFVGWANHYFFRAGARLAQEAGWGDAHLMARLGVGLGLVGAGLLASGRRAEVACLAAAVGGGTLGNLAGTVVGCLAGLLAGGAVSAPVDAVAWLLELEARSHVFGPVFRLVRPTFQVLMALAMAAGAGAETYQKLRPPPAETAPAEQV